MQRRSWTAGGGTHGSGAKNARREEAMGTEERQEAEEQAAAERKAREVKAMMTNRRRGAKECTAAERKVRDEEADAM